MSAFPPFEYLVVIIIMTNLIYSILRRVKKHKSAKKITSYPAFFAVGYW